MFGLFKRRRDKPKSQSPSINSPSIHPLSIQPNKSFGIKVAGTSHRQDELHAIIAASKEARGLSEGQDYYDEDEYYDEANDYRVVIADLIPEEDNPHDDNAVRVEIGNLHVGYINRSYAKRYRNALGTQQTRCKAKIIGSGTEGYSYGIRLSMKFPLETF